jgi:hypothetical protein
MGAMSLLYVGTVLSAALALMAASDAKHNAIMGFIPGYPFIAF